MTDNIDNGARTREGSQIIRRKDGKREGHLVAIQPLTIEGRNGEREIDYFRIYMEASVYLAFYHFNQRSGEVLPDLPDRLKDCDFYWTLQQCDSRFSPIYAAKQMLEVANTKLSTVTSSTVSAKNAASKYRRDLAKTIAEKQSLSSSLPPSSSPGAIVDSAAIAVNEEQALLKEQFYADSANGNNINTADNNDNDNNNADNNGSYTATAATTTTSPPTKSYNNLQDDLSAVDTDSQNSTLLVGLPATATSNTNLDPYGSVIETTTSNATTTTTATDTPYPNTTIITTTVTTTTTITTTTTTTVVTTTTTASTPSGIGHYIGANEGTIQSPAIIETTVTTRPTIPPIPDPPPAPQLPADTLTNDEPAATVVEEPENSLIISNSISSATTLPAKDNEQEEERHPFAILGSWRSAVTQPLSILAEPFQLPVISAASTSADLDGQPFFSRTIPTNYGDALAIAIYLNQFNVTHVGILYQQDSWGVAFHADLVREFSNRDIKVASSSYLEINMETSVKYLASTGYKYFVGILNAATWKDVARFALSHKIIGLPGYTWVLTEGSTEFISPSFALDKQTDADLASAIHGTALVSIDIPTHGGFNAALEKFASNNTMQKAFIETHREKHLFDDLTVFPGTESSLYQTTTYDAAIALGLAACETPDLFTGEEFYNILKTVEFQGVSGYVSFDRRTGTRTLDDLQFSVRNILLSDDRSTETEYKFSYGISALVRTNLGDKDAVETIKPFIFADSTTIPPISIPPVDMELNLLSKGTQIGGFVFGAVAFMISIIWIIWTIKYRNSNVVRASQPFFLAQLCIGTIIISLSVIPLALQEPVDIKILNIGCISIPWLLSVGFVTAFSALFSKTYRLNKLMKEASNFRRIEIHPKDVMMPFVVMMTCNFGLLIAWTAGEPPIWERAELDNFDSYGRSQESYGHCLFIRGSSSLTYCLFIVALNIFAIIKGFKQSYIARNLPTEFSESFYLAISMASILETIILSIPAWLAAAKNPTASYLVRSGSLCIFCLTILLPIFIPKYLKKGLVDVETRSRAASRGANSTLLSHRLQGVTTRATGARRTITLNSGTGSNYVVPSTQTVTNASRAVVYNQYNGKASNFSITEPIPEENEAGNASFSVSEIESGNIVSHNSSISSSGKMKVHRSDAYYTQLKKESEHG